MRTLKNIIIITYQLLEGTGDELLLGSSTQIARKPRRRWLRLRQQLHCPAGVRPKPQGGCTCHFEEHGQPGKRKEQDTIRTPIMLKVWPDSALLMPLAFWPCTVHDAMQPFQVQSSRTLTNSDFFMSEERNCRGGNGRIKVEISFLFFTMLQINRFNLCPTQTDSKCTSGGALVDSYPSHDQSKEKKKEEVGVGHNKSPMSTCLARQNSPFKEPDQLFQPLFLSFMMLTGTVHKFANEAEMEPLRVEVRWAAAIAIVMQNFFAVYSWRELHPMLQLLWSLINRASLIGYKTENLSSLTFEIWRRLFMNRLLGLSTLAWASELLL